MAVKGLSVVLWLDKGDSPKLFRLCVRVVINERSFETFLCLGLVLER